MHTPTRDSGPPPPDLDRLAAIARREVPLVVEVAVAREERLVRALHDAAVANDRGGVVLPDRALIVGRRRVVVDEADDRRDAARCRRDLLQRALVGREERRVLDQIADAVAGQRQLGGDDDVGARGRGGLDGRGDPGGVSGDVRAGGIDLGEGDAHPKQTVSCSRYACPRRPT